MTDHDIRIIWHVACGLVTLAATLWCAGWMQRQSLKKRRHDA